MFKLRLKQINENNSCIYCCIILEEYEKLSQIKREALASLQSMKQQNIDRVVDKETRKIPKRVLSSPRGKFEYSSKCPLEIKSLIKEIKGSIEVSEIHSKKLFDLCSKLANKDSIKLPDVPTTKNHTSELNNSIQNVKRRSVYSPRPYKREANKTMIKSREFPLQSRKNDQSDNEVSDPKQLNFTSRVLDKEECQVNYKLINEKMKNKMMKTKFTKHTLFLFNPLKIRLRSPNSKRKNYLI